MIFAALAGSSPVALVAIGSIVIAGMVRAGYAAGQAAGVIGAGATMGGLIPPAIVMVIYAAATGTDLGRMLLAGTVPALAGAVLLMMAVLILARITGLPRQPRASLRQISAAGAAALWDLLPVAIVLGGICSGLLSASEAAALAGAYGFVVVVLVDRDIGPLKPGSPYRPAWADRPADGSRRAARFLIGLIDLAYGLVVLPVAILHHDLRGVLIEAARTTIVLLFIFVNASLFAHVLARQEMAADLVMAIAGLEPWLLLAAVSVVLLLLGQLMEPAAMVMVAAPLFPIAMAVGVDPIHLGIVVVVSVEIAMMVPPAGLGLFVATGITALRGPAAIRAALPWLGVLLLLVALLIAVPRIATFLPDVVYGPRVPV
jgi:C4-dicarboxylate transporter DctM subunit